MSELRQASELINELMRGLEKTVREVVPSFLATMPAAYFQDTDSATQLEHLRAIVSAKSSAAPIRMTLRTEDGSRWTFVHEHNYSGLLTELMRQLPTDRALRSAKVHTAADGHLVLDVFQFGDPAARFDPSDPEQTEKRHQTLRYAESRSDADAMRALDAHLLTCSADYLRTVTPLRIYETFRLTQSLTGTEDTEVTLTDELDPNFKRISIAAGNANPRSLFERVVTLLGRERIDIRRAYLDEFNDGSSTLSVLGLVVEDAGRRLDEKHDWPRLRRDLLRLRWLDPRVIEVAHQHNLDLLDAEILSALAHLVHPALAKRNSYAFARDRLEVLLLRALPTARAIAAWFLDRFRPGVRPSEPDLLAEKARIEHQIEAQIETSDTRVLMHALLNAVASSLKTNVFLERRYALAIRFAPDLLTPPERGEQPYGAFFVSGRGFDGYHVRFRDIARGGVRVVRPLGPEQHALETERLYDEAYDLASAQQLKNKDIPEGGAKAVILVEPSAQVELSVKAFTDGLLDLLSPVSQDRLVDRFGQEELLYLGPDENISPALIDWMVLRAERRGYPTPNAFMSSKPGAGINHKVYGVTSEGVTVFLEEALRSIGIDPRSRPFSVKITGGPDGDVAGNEIKILAREYGPRARIVGIADGSGSAEDPDGLDHAELLRLVELSVPIAEFSRQRLGPKGRVVALSEPEGVRLRNTLHNRVRSDAFVPAGGRPQTINASNWRDFLIDGQPSSRVIVEGANLYITKEARLELAKTAGCVIVKDSSANKCGVICSSFEIVASMLLSSDEFLAIKDRFVAEVLDRLRLLARREAEMLFREQHHHPELTLPELSIELSRVIIRATDAVRGALSGLEPSDGRLLDELVRAHLPPSLLAVAGERIAGRVPRRYLDGIIASSLSTRIVYREGLDYLRRVEGPALAQRAVAYLRQEREVQGLIAELDRSDLPSRTRIQALLERAGARAGLELGEQGR